MTFLRSRQNAWVFALFFLLLPSVALAQQARIKDLVEFDGVRGNDLVGYGLVVGLNGTGDGLRNSPVTLMPSRSSRLTIASSVNGEL
ncbi:MAG: flagellar basal body P-ring protein FlgI, partial [Pseudomonadota bacterium]